MFQCTSLETELQSEKTNNELVVCELNSEISNLKKEPDDESLVEKQKEEFLMKLSLLQVMNCFEYFRQYFYSGLIIINTLFSGS